MYNYLIALIIISAVFVVIERARPRHPEQGFVRPRLLSDLAYFIVNGHLLGVGLALASEPLVRWVQARLELAAGAGWWTADVAATWPLWVQLVVAFFVLDLLQWCVHNLLHRVPALWAIHKVHHSIRHMDFWGSLRFHWGEILVYRTLLYLPGVWFGFDGGVLFALALISTTIGHFNHANLDVGLGPLGKVLNNPRMHVWHHHNDEGHPVLINFGINLSLWDYLFGTAHVPERPPEALGFPDVEEYPQTFLGQLVYPLPAERWVRRLRNRTPAGALPASEITDRAPRTDSSPLHDGPETSASPGAGERAQR